MVPSVRKVLSKYISKFISKCSCNSAMHNTRANYVTEAVVSVHTYLYLSSYIAYWLRVRAFEPDGWLRISALPP